MGSGYFGGLFYGQYSLGGTPPTPPAFQMPEAVEAHNVMIAFPEARGLTVTHPGASNLIVTPDE